MLMIRLTKVGGKHARDFRLIVNEKRSPPRSGRYIEILGNYNPVQKRINIKKERVEHWLSKGARPSATVHNLLVRQGIIKGKKISVHKASKKEEKTEKPQEAVVKVEEAPKKGEKVEAVEKIQEAEKVEEVEKVEEKAIDGGAEIKGI